MSMDRQGRLDPTRLREHFAALLLDLPRQGRWPKGPEKASEDSTAGAPTSLESCLRSFRGLPEGVGNRVRDLAVMLREDPEDAGISIASVQSLCRFLVTHTVRIPVIAADGDGQLVAEWLDGTAGRLGMKFRTDGLVEFGLAGGREAGHPGRVRLCGTEDPAKAAMSVRAITGRFPYA